MKVLVAYYSDTGNTEKIGKAISEEASKKDKVDLKKIKDVTVDNLNDYDFVFLGSPCIAGDIATPVKKLLTAIPKSPKFKLAAFLTHMSPVSEKHDGYGRCLVSFENAKKEKQVDFKGSFDCQGGPAPRVQELVKQGRNVPADLFEKLMAEARKHPSPEDQKRAKEFARQVLQNI
jgi:flavodoxin